MRELAEASDAGRIIEMFGSGTAAIVSPIKLIRYVQERDPQTGEAKRFKDLHIPLDPTNTKSQAGPLTKRLSETIMSKKLNPVALVSLFY